MSGQLSMFSVQCSMFSVLATPKGSLLQAESILLNLRERASTMMTHPVFRLRRNPPLSRGDYPA